MADCWLLSFPFFWQHHLEEPSWPRNEEEKLPQLLQLAQPHVSGYLFVCWLLCWFPLSSLARSLPVSVAGSGGVSVPRCQSGDFVEELPPYVSELHCSFILELGLVWLQLHEVTPVWSLGVLQVMQPPVQDPDSECCCPSLSPQHPRIHCHSAAGTATRWAEPFSLLLLPQATMS